MQWPVWNLMWSTTCKIAYVPSYSMLHPQKNIIAQHLGISPLFLPFFYIFTVIVMLRRRRNSTEITNSCVKQASKQASKQPACNKVMLQMFLLLGLMKFSKVLWVFLSFFPVLVAETLMGLLMFWVYVCMVSGSHIQSLSPLHLFSEFVFLEFWVCIICFEPFQCPLMLPAKMIVLWQ